MRRSITVRFRSKDFTIAWYLGTSDSAIRECIRETLELPPEANVVLRDDKDVIIAVNNNLPDGLRLFAEQRSAENVMMVEDPKSGNGASTTSANSFRGELLKFERINAHLANERTWLAWVRTALSTMSCAFAFLSLSSSGTYEILCYIIGCIFCAAVILVFTTGWHRYGKVKIVLGLSFTEMTNNFDRFGVHWVAWLFAALFVSTAALYWAGVLIDLK
jgi:uncharacterized membrane protein YidH (DUF202 family)